MGYIYLVTNLSNDKKYVGQTTLSVQERWNRHIYDALYKYDDFYFHKAIRKYGPEQFKVEEICKCDNDKLDEKEIYYIDYFKTYYIYQQGYNLTRGGNGTTKINEKEIMALWNTGLSAIEIARKFNFYIRTVTNVLKQHNILQKEIYSRSQKYCKNKLQKRIYQYDLNGNLMNVYENLNEMHEKTGYRKDYISAACRHQYPSANGYLWIYETEEESIEELLKKIPPSNNHPVLQYSLDGHLIREYQSYSAAAKVVGTDKTNIARAAKTPGSTAKGYFWKDKDNDASINEAIQIKENRYNDRKRQICQYDLNDNFIASYDSIIAAAKALDKVGSYASIGRVCRGEAQIACGYKWRYKE